MPQPLFLDVHQPQQKGHVGYDPNDHRVEGRDAGMKAQSLPAGHAGATRREQGLDQQKQAEAAEKDDELAGIQIQRHGRFLMKRPLG